jgi:carboxymethylenebutenolidase
VDRAAIDRRRGRPTGQRTRKKANTSNLYEYEAESGFASDCTIGQFLTAHLTAMEASMSRIFCFLVAASLLFAQAASAADIIGRKMVLHAQEREVNVTFFRAPGDAPRPAVLLLHGANGFDSQIANYNRYASELANNGMDAYLVYYYSNADEDRITRDPDLFSKRYVAWTKLVSDLAADLKKQTTANGKIGLVGFSNGGILSTGISARDPNISAAVIYYGTPPFPMESPVTRFPPLLILHGDADAIIPVEQGRRLTDMAKKLGGAPEMVIYPGERHGFGSRLQTDNGADALKRTVTFLRRELNAH